MSKSFFFISENEDADQLHSYHAADQCLCFRYIDCTIPLLPKPEISSLWSSSMALQPSLCRTWPETLKTGFLATQLIYYAHLNGVTVCVSQIYW